MRFVLIDAAVRISFRTVFLSISFLTVEVGVVNLEGAEALIKGDVAKNKGRRCWHWEFFQVLCYVILMSLVCCLVYFPAVSRSLSA